MPPSSAAKSRKWAFTLNNPTGGAELYGDEWVVEYLVVGHEIAPETGTPHHQGYVRFANPRALAGVRKLLPRAHWEPVKGTEQQNYNYCSKEQVIVIELGEREVPEDASDQKQPGKRSDIALARSIISDGGGMIDVVHAVNSYQAIKCAEVMLKYLEQPRNWKPEVIWLWGKTNVGKSHLAMQLCPNAWCSADHSKWFEGYDAHENVVLDELREDWCPFTTMLRLLDKWPYRIEFKGGSRQFLARKIVITSAQPPHVVYANRKGEDLQQLGRRIDQIVEIRGRGEALWVPGKSIGLPYAGRALAYLYPEPEPELEVEGNTAEEDSKVPPMPSLERETSSSAPEPTAPDPSTCTHQLSGCYVTEEQWEATFGWPPADYGETK